MSSWTYDVKIDVGPLMERLSRLESLPEWFETLADNTKADVKNNILDKEVYDTGALYESIDAEAEADGFMLHDGVSYGVYNEFGTYKMAPRPFFVPACEKIGPKVEEHFHEILK